METKKPATLFINGKEFNCAIIAIETNGTYVTELYAGEIKPKETNIKFYNMPSTLSKKEQLAHKMYDDYCEAVGGKAFNGDPLPKSQEFFSDPNKTKQSNAWIVAAETAIDFLEYNL
jgi:hypothetical protein